MKVTGLALFSCPKSGGSWIRQGRNRMTWEFENFADQFTDELGVQIHEQTGLKSYSMGIQTVEGEQGRLAMLWLRPEGEESKVTINLTETYEKYQEGESIASLANQMAGELARVFRDLPGKEENFMADYDEVKPRLFVDLVSADQNREKLQDVPYKSFEDMAMVYRVMVDPKDEGKGSVLITNDLLQNYGVTMEQLHQDAIENSVKTRPAIMNGLSEILGFRSCDRDEEVMFAASVQGMSHGAGVIAYPGFLDQVSKELGTDLFVLPSSIHEVLFIRDNRMIDARELTALVQDVNRQEVRPEERLSNYAFHYDSQEHIFERAEQFQARTQMGPVVQGKTEESQSRYDGREDHASLLGSLSDKAEKVKEEKAKPFEHRRETKGKGGEAI